ncbi:hypothetical protein [Streptomyces alkaliterrae]|uniref:Uncharacterized protein n=1 Tax=Streptomyces alkaliterrae TaxID=2213162 RepID=A0A7W3WVW6_9ACTN|nr:hypothetical protein [Streptomyces alkaliterrae]MBB1259456.1 hypothetical protein [Streptomyces alkaliterrae]
MEAFLVCVALVAAAAPAAWLMSRAERSAYRPGRRGPEERAAPPVTGVTDAPAAASTRISVDGMNGH